MMSMARRVFARALVAAAEIRMTSLTPCLAAVAAVCLVAGLMGPEKERTWCIL